jgi:hypothetical protein
MVRNEMHTSLSLPHRYNVGVHITADVGHFIKSGTAIDREAASRNTTPFPPSPHPPTIRNESLASPS